MMKADRLRCMMKQIQQKWFLMAKAIEENSQWQAKQIQEFAQGIKEIPPEVSESLIRSFVK